MKKRTAKLQKFTAAPFTDDDFFDDCPVCQYTKEMMRQGKPQTYEGLKQAFKKANTSN